MSPEVLHDIQAAVAGARPVTAALGDADDEAKIERDARLFTTAGVTLVKVGFAGITDPGRVGALTAAAVRGARDGNGGVVVVAYADATHAASLAPAALVVVAARAGATGLLIDTAGKGGPGLRELVAWSVLAAWVSEAQEAGLLVALAGQLTADDMPFVREAGADIAGVRGAACDGGRTGRVSAGKVRMLGAVCRLHDAQAKSPRESRSARASELHNPHVAPHSMLGRCRNFEPDCVDALSRRRYARPQAA